MSISDFLAGIPVNANLRLKIEQLLSENDLLRSEKAELLAENAVLKNKVTELEAKIEKLKKPKDPSHNPYMARVTRV